MTKRKSTIEPPSLRELVAAVENERALLLDENRREYVDRQHAKGRQTARERIVAFLDAGSFREIGPLVGNDGGDSRSVAPADGLVIGYGRLDGRPVGVSAHDHTALAGSSGSAGSAKNARQVDLCIEHGYPFVMLCDSTGHRIREGLSSAHFAVGLPSVKRMCELSGWVPVVCAVMGEGWTGPASVAGMSDFVVSVRGTSNIALAGPPLVKIALGKHVTKEELGDPDVQAGQNGIVDLVVDTEAEALAAIRRYLGYLPSNAQQLPPRVPCSDPAGRREDALLDIVPSNLRMAYDVRKAIRLIVDGDSFFELKPAYAKNFVTAFARLHGQPVGIIANQPNFLAGALDAAACEKGAHFASICNAFGLPMVYFVDTPGFLVGPDAERSGLSRRAAKLLMELARATVPLATVILRKGYGLGYIAMNGGRSFGSELVVAWPTLEVAAMSVEGGVNVAFRNQYKDAPDPEAKRLEILAEMKARTSWLPAAEAFGVDDVIDPRDTRAWLIDALATCAPRRRPSNIPKLHPITPI